MSGELGLRKFLEDAGHSLVVTSDKDGPDSVFERELADADIVISQCRITVTEITYSNSISDSEHVVMTILSLVRNYIPSYQWVVKGGWNIADCVERSYDLEGMAVGSVAARLGDLGNTSHVGVHGRPDGEHEAGETGQGQGGAEGERGPRRG